MMVSIYKIYRSTASLEEQIKAAMADFYRRRRTLPVEIVVSKRQVEQARKVAQALELAVPVNGSGGCLVGEVWLG